ncbi:hypothetical protein Tco_0577432, partial [Tanacetum coccineum]
NGVGSVSGIGVGVGIVGGVGIGGGVGVGVRIVSGGGIGGGVGVVMTGGDDVDGTGGVVDDDGWDGATTSCSCPAFGLVATSNIAGNKGLGAPR